MRSLKTLTMASSMAPPHLSAPRLSFVSLAALAFAAALGGCGNEDQGYCFPDGNCNGATAGSAGSVNLGGQAGSAGSGGSVNVAGGNAGAGGVIFGGSGGSAGSAGGGCDTTNIKSCGSCDNDCTKTVQNVPISAITCADGVCGFTKEQGCAPNFYDIDGDPSNGCEFGPCKKTADKDDTCDGLDNDCDNQIDEEVDLCATASCGSCKRDCATAFPNAEGSCNKSDPGASSCSEASTQCQFVKCADGFFDGDGDPSNGCEVKCSPTDLDGKPLPAGQAPVEFCGDNIDNDCDGKIDFDDPDTQTEGPKADPRLFKACTGGDKGDCTTEGKTQCVAVGVSCVGSPKPGELPETCDGKDNDCNGFIDDALSDLGACGQFSLGRCRKGQASCENGVSSCLGNVDPDVEVCNAVDDDCDGVVDGTLPSGGALVDCTDDAGCPAGQVCRTYETPDVTKKVCAMPTTSEGGACDTPPAGAGPGCKAGTFTCVNAALVCQGSVSSGNPDKCGEDTNCNGVLENQPDTKTDPLNCGSCGNDCNAQNPGGHLVWTCVNGACQKPTNPATKCEQGFIDCDGNPDDCEQSCTFLSDQEVCNGVDDNCNCKTDETQADDPKGIVVPSPSQACGVSATAAAVDPACGLKSGANPGGIDVKCEGGKFVCTFPADHCSQGNPPSCAATVDVCDGKDNNCNGVADENFKAPIKSSDALDQPCASDDGKATSDGECRAVGKYVCTPDKAGTVCSVKGGTLKCGVAAGDSTFNQKPCDELCDGKDNDCDGFIDEPHFKDKANPFNAGEARTAAPGSSSGSFLKPAVVKIGDSLWMNAYEVWRPKATSSTAGSGNGYWTTAAGSGAPAGTALDKTPACNDPLSGSNPGRIPWFNVTPVEAHQTCNSMGGRLCRQSEWQSACQVNAVTGASPKKNCTWAYSAGCTTSAPQACNTKLFDFDKAVAGDQDGLLPSASASTPKCFADWSGAFTSGPGANPATAQLFDLTGNLREITVLDSDVSIVDPSKRRYALMGGAFNSDEQGAACNFSFYTVEADFQLFSVGFRCCFDEYPD